MKMSMRDEYEILAMNFSHTFLTYASDVEEEGP